MYYILILIIYDLNSNQNCYWWKSTSNKIYGVERWDLFAKSSNTWNFKWKKRKSNYSTLKSFTSLLYDLISASYTLQYCFIHISIPYKINQSKYNMFFGLPKILVFFLINYWILLQRDGMEYIKKQSNLNRSPAGRQSLFFASSPSSCFSLNVFYINHPTFPTIIYMYVLTMIMYSLEILQINYPKIKPNV